MIFILWLLEDCADLSNGELLREMEKGLPGVLPEYPWFLYIQKLYYYITLTRSPRKPDVGKSANKWLCDQKHDNPCQNYGQFIRWRFPSWIQPSKSIVYTVTDWVQSFYWVEIENLGRNGCRYTLSITLSCTLFCIQLFFCTWLGRGWRLVKVTFTCKLMM